jgi:hypothetical protein
MERMILKVSANRYVESNAIIAIDFRNESRFKVWCLVLQGGYVMDVSLEDIKAVESISFSVHSDHKEDEL